jgi:hypothetical protein
MAPRATLACRRGIAAIAFWHSHHLDRAAMLVLSGFSTTKGVATMHDDPVVDLSPDCTDGLSAYSFSAVPAPERSPVTAGATALEAEPRDSSFSEPSAEG